MGRTLLHGLLKLIVVSVSKLLRYLASKGIKLSFTLNFVLKRADDLETISLSTCFDLLQKFEASCIVIVPELVRHNRDIINILLTSSSRSVL